MNFSLLNLILYLSMGNYDGILTAAPVSQYSYVPEKQYCSDSSPDIQGCAVQLNNSASMYEVIATENNNENTDDDDNVKYDNNPIDYYPIRRTKRNYRNVPNSKCICNGTNLIKTTGHTTFPRIIRTEKCSTNNCPLGLTCIPIHYKIKLLTPREEEPSSARDDGIIPLALQSCWRVREVDVVVACVCGYRLV